jgi:hypothetical protein
MSIIVNNKTVYSFKKESFETNAVSAKLYTLTNGKSFLDLHIAGWGRDCLVSGIFQYKNGKLSQVVNFKTLFNKYGTYNDGTVISVKGNTITTEYSLMSWALGYCSLNYTYAYKNGTLQRTSAVSNIYTLYSSKKNTTTYYANRTLVTYSAVNTTKKAFSIPKGAAVTVDKCFMGGGNMYIRVKYKGKYGWLKAGTSPYTTNCKKQFSNVVYAG